MSSSFNNCFEKKVSFTKGRGGFRRDATNASTAAVSSHTMVPVQEEFADSATSDGTGTFVDSGTFGDSSSTSFPSKRVSFHDDTRVTTKIVVRTNSRPEPVTSFHESDELERSATIVEDSATFNDSASSSKFNDSVAGGQSQDYSTSHSQDYSTSHQSIISSESTFVPQRFDEMRSLLLNITPLQLEALVHEIFSGSTSSAGSYLSGGNNTTASRQIPKEWKGIRKKSKRYKFRINAYLGEMGFHELRNFAESVELWSIVDNDRCESYDDAMDIFAVEFERLVVSGQQSRGGGSTTRSVAEGEDASYYSQRNLEDDILSYVSGNSSVADEGENLRRSLRACSVPELRLVAERLNLDHSCCGNSKTDLIVLIESSMPDMSAAGSHDGEANRSPPSPMPLHPPPYPTRHSGESNGGNAAMYVEESYEQQQQLDAGHKRVKFSTDCKEDTSHLIPKREVNEAVWGNYVVDELAEEDVGGNRDDLESSQPLVLYDGRGNPEENGDNKKRRRIKGNMKWPEQRRRLIVVGLFISVVVGIVLGLVFGLAKDRSQDSLPSSNSYMTGPWSMGYGDPFENSEPPSMSPSEADTSFDNEVVVLDSPREKSVAPTWKPTQQPIELTPSPYESGPYTSGGVLTTSIEILTNSPTKTSEATTSDGVNLTDFFMGDPTAKPTTAQTEMGVSTATPTNATVSIVTEQPTSSPPSAQPTTSTTDELYPLLGPFDQTGMRMILNGITELSSMGRTQWKMLTSAFVEQFYNQGEKGDDAIQNIVFDVNADIEITADERLDAGGGRRLQSGSLILTFTMKISYHTFSAFLDTATVAERPFSEDSMRANYVQYLANNNGKTFIGDVTSISPIFRGDEIPSEYITSPAKQEETLMPAISIQTPTPSSPVKTPVPSPPVETPVPLASADTPVPSSSADTPVPSSSVDTPVPSSSVDTPVPSPLDVSKPSVSDGVSALTPRPTTISSEATPPPTQIAFVGATYSPVVSPKVVYTYSPVSGESEVVSPNVVYTYSPVSGESEVVSPKVVYTYSPVGGKSEETPYPTSNAFNWPRETPSPIGTNHTLVPTGIATNSFVYTTSPTSFSTDIATNSIVYSDSPTQEPTLSQTPRPTSSPRKKRSAPPTRRPIEHPTIPPSESPSLHPTASPSHEPTLRPTASPTISPMLCDLVPDQNCRGLEEVHWDGEFEIGQTHVVKAVGETRRAPRMIAHREAELLFTPADSRRLGTFDTKRRMPTAQRIESVGTVYLSSDTNRIPVFEKVANALLDGSNTLFWVDVPDIDITVDLKSLRLIEEISILLPDQVSIENVRIGLRYDDGQNTEEQNDIFHYPKNGWLWHDVETDTESNGSKMSLSIPKRKARYVAICFKGGHMPSSSRWSLQGIEIIGYLDGLSDQIAPRITPKTRAVVPRTVTRKFTPPKTASVRIAMYSSSGRLLGLIDVRDPSKQRRIFESQLSAKEIAPYSDAAWSATLPFNWVDEGNMIMIGCVDKSRPTEVLVHRLELKDLAQFSEHSITRTKMAIFGTDEDLSKLDTKTFDGRKLVRNLYAAIPAAELKWADTDLWHLPYLVVMSKDGIPSLVTSEEERRSVTGVGTEVEWEVIKNHLTIRHALAQAGLGFAETGENGNNSPYASHTSVFMGWSLSKQENDGPWQWEDLGYWDTLAAAAWTGWVAMKAGDECSNYFIHELGHAQSMQHFDNGTAAKWGIETEYPNDGVYTSKLPWGFDSVASQFRTWFDPRDGTGKKDPLNGEGEPPYSQNLNCFSQYTPYQAQVSQEWAMSSPILLSASTSNVPRDGAYLFNSVRRQYVPLDGSDLLDTAGENAMTPVQVSVPVITLIGTIGANREVCQTYPELRGYGNTFLFPDPFQPGLPSAYYEASYFVEIRLENGQKIRALIAVKDAAVSEKPLSFYSFNVAIDPRPIAVDLYRFVNSSYPDVTSESETQLLHIRPIELPSEDPLQGMPRQLRVGRGWLGDSPKPLLDTFCTSSDQCKSDKNIIEWRGNVRSDDVVYRSTLQGKNDDELNVTIFKVPALRQQDSSKYTITVLAARFFDDALGMSPLLTSRPLTGSGPSSLDVTHMIRIWAPWEMNDSLPVGVYRSLPDVFKISADAIDTSNSHFHHNILELNVELFIGTVTAPPTFAPTKRPSSGPTPSPVPVRYHIEWKVGTCVTDGSSSEWAPPYTTKEECCESHMHYEYSLCMSREG
eukprot:CCRYP_016470-RA/>CCRYP_016470-RA protein AED:0.00 eAED:0.00 QI:898/1/1/1/0.66/0.57/7/803/2196